MTRQRSQSMQGPEGRPPNVSPARKGWEAESEEDPSAVGAALNRSSAPAVSLGEPARVRGLVYQLVTEAQNTRQQIQAKGVSVFPRMEPGLTWVTLTAISSIVFSISQLQPQYRNWNFARDLCGHALALLMAPGK